MAEIEITHTRAEGTILSGSSKGDGIFEIVRPFGFWFSRNVDGLFIKRSRDKAADTWRIYKAADALREAGHTVTVEINERARRSFAEAEADREERADDRADRYSDRADRAAASSEARYQASKAISDHMTGEPIKIGHHSERRHRRDIERMDGHMRAWIQEGKKASHYADRARAAENYAAFRKDPYRTLRRLKKLRADLRQQERYAQEYPNSERHAVNVLDLREEIAHWEQIVQQAKEDGIKIWGPDDFAPGDYVRYSGSWYQVKRVNPETLSIAWNLRLAPKQVMTLEDATERGRTWTHPADYTNVRARCPEAAMHAFLADGKVPGTKAAAEASEAQPASAVREAQAAKPKKSRTAKRSDPKVAKRLLVVCDLAGEVAELTWLNGNSRPHKDFEPLLITPPDGERFRRAVYGKDLQARIAEAVENRGYAYGPDDWALNRDRTGWVRSVELKTAPEQPAAPATAEAPEAEEAEDDVPAGNGETPGEVDKTALTCENSEETRNHTGGSRVGISDNPLTPTPQEDAMTAYERRVYGRDLTYKERIEAQKEELRARAAEVVEIERTPELDFAYKRHVDDGIASTDGWYIPLDFQAWASTLGAPLIRAAAEREAAAKAEQPAEAEEAEGAAVEDAADEPEQEAPQAEKTALTCENSESTRNHTDSSRVGNSDYPLTPTQEAPTMTTTKPAKAPKTEKKAPAPKKAAPKKTAPAPAPAEIKTVQKTVPIDRIERDPGQPRQLFDQAKLEELAGSIKELGLLQPVSLRYVPSTKKYVLIAGERRWRASKLAGLTEMPAVVSHGIQDGDRETLARQVAENCGRADMTPIEEAESFRRLTEAGFTVEEVAKRVGKSGAYVGWRIDLLRLTEPLREALAKGHLQVGLAWYVSLLNADNQMRFLVRHARGEFKSVRDAEAFAQAARNEEKRQEEQGSFFVLSDEATDGNDDQEAIPGSLDLPESEREQLVDDRRKLTGKIDKLSVMGEILSELASADPETLAVLLAGTPGGVPGHQLRIEHLRELTMKAHKNLRQAQAIAAVRAGSIAINPEAAATSAV
ncbi:ParB/RepB/Spo0J family partition protein [Streptomyces parvulus]|uniref:ParB/RepB/Spo0J family partition protein n=1 Tax=Streptomyces parvulus TaxID=146923 RepID=UPI003800A5EE